MNKNKQREQITEKLIGMKIYHAKKIRNIERALKILRRAES